MPRRPPRLAATRLVATLALALGVALLGGAAAAPARAAPTAGPAAAPVVAMPGDAQLAQYYAPPPPRPHYRHRRQRCWTEMQRVVRHDRWGRPYVRMVPRTVCRHWR